MISTSRQLALAVGAEPPSNGSGGGRRQCWECQRRRVVCDATRPVCGKCKAAGVVCPGYEDKKPLTWLAPGKVKTRTWKRKKSAEKTALPSTTSEETVDNSRRMLQHVGTRIMHVFPGHELRTETCDVVEATLYWNESVYPSFSTTQLMPSPWVIPVSYVHMMPAATRHALVSMAIEHRMIRLAGKKNDPYIFEVRSRFHQHRTLAITALNEDVRNESTRGSDLTMASVLVFMYADLMGSSTAANWRYHMNGCKVLMEMRGGLEAIYRETPYMAPLLLFPAMSAGSNDRISIEIFANSTSPSDDQSDPLETFAYLDTVTELYGKGYYPFLPCPVDLFYDVIMVNRLRFIIATNSLTEDMGMPQFLAEELLERIVEFSPEVWSETRVESKEEFLLMAQVYQSAVALYAISSLQSPRALPSSAGWRAVRNIHYGRLVSLLEKAAEDPLTKNCVTWPLIVAGFEAATGTAEGRKFVVNQLMGMSRDLGVHSPLIAVEMLDKFWASGKRTWEDCSDKPYALVT